MGMVTGAWKSQSSRDADPAALGPQASDEDASLTPIFHSLAGGTRRREPARSPHTAPLPQAGACRMADPVAEFEQDPLHAPIPPQKLAGPSQVRVLRSVSGGRHRR
jgi:hypothetical protein